MSKKIVINGEECEIEESPADQIVSHFKGNVELSKTLSRYHELSVEIASLEGIKEDLRKQLIEAGRGEESISAGGYAAFFKAVKGRCSMDWQRAYKDAVGEMPEADVSKYIKQGTDSVRVEVKKLG